MDSLLQPGAPFHGAYTIVRLIGRGGIGEVYEARHDFLGRRVAIKCMRVQPALVATAAKRMAKEAQALCALDHPNIIRIFDAGIFGDVAFMICELLEGGTLRDKLEAEGALPLLPTLRYHVEWTDALAQVHAGGIIHRDLKPENVFITRAGPSKLLDFGAALDSSQRITVKGHTVGTPAYMAPEHLTGDGDIDVRADVYPMGIMLFEALTGQHPFWAPTETELPDHFEFARRHLFEPWPRITKVAPHVPPAVEAIIDRCLAKEREGRFPSMIALRDALQAALAATAAPQAIPLVNRAPVAQVKTKPMPRQTAMRLDAVVIGTMRMPAHPGPIAATPTPPPVAQPGYGVQPTGYAQAARGSVPTMEDPSLVRTSSLGQTQQPPSALARRAPLPTPSRPRSRAPAFFATFAVLLVAVAGVGWALFGGKHGEATPALATVSASAPPSAEAPPPSSAPAAAAAPEPSSAPEPPPVASAAPADPAPPASAAPTPSAAPAPPADPAPKATTVKPRPVRLPPPQTPKREPIFG